jgi:uncharacterized protein YndB with AHSA1/START domain
MTTTHAAQLIRAPRPVVYQALTDAAAIARWRVPPGMTSEVHSFDPRVGGAFRVSLTYDAPTGTGKTTSHTDTYHGHFVELVPDERVVERLAFETSNPEMQGEMTITYALSDAVGGTALTAVHEGVPPGVAPEDNALGWEQSLRKLAAYAEGGGAGRAP